VDEVLAVGDLAFQRKCFDRMEAMINDQGRTVLIVSHNIRQVERLCDRVLLLSNGQVIMDGVPVEICNKFYEINDDKISASHSNFRSEQKTGDIELVSVLITDDAGNKVENVVSGRGMNVEMTYLVKAPLIEVNFGLGVHTIDFIYLATNNWFDEHTLVNLNAGMVTVIFRIDRILLLPRKYSLRVGVSIGEKHVPIYYSESVTQFQVVAPSASISRIQETGFFIVEGAWELHENNNSFEYQDISSMVNEGGR
jgi:hypothetical protein